MRGRLSAYRRGMQGRRSGNLKSGGWAAVPLEIVIRVTEHPEEVQRLLMHEVRGFRTLLVIQSQEVEGAVYEQKVQDGLETATVDPGHFLGGGGGDHDVAEHFGGDIAELSLMHGEGQNIGAVFDPAVFGVQAGHFLIVDQRDAQLGLSAPQRA